MTNEREAARHVYSLRPGETFRPFETVRPLEPDQHFACMALWLEGVGRGEVVFERTGEPALELYVAGLRRRGKEILAPYGPIPVEYLIEPGAPPFALTPCELDLYFSLPVSADPPPCMMEIPSRGQRFLGVLSQPDESIWPYRWLTTEGQEVVLLLPNRREALQEITIRFLGD